MRCFWNGVLAEERSPDRGKEGICAGTVVPNLERIFVLGALLLCVSLVSACSEFQKRPMSGAGALNVDAGYAFSNGDAVESGGSPLGGNQADAQAPWVTCGDMLCDNTESCADCPGDCGACASCGNGACDGQDTTGNCPKDCGAKCGDGVCNGPEYPQSCPQDCDGQPAAICDVGTDCITLSAGTGSVTMTLEEGLPPTLNGGAAPSGLYFLKTAKVYPDSLTLGAAFPIELEMKDAGQTHGSAKFDGGSFAVSLQLNIYAAFPTLDQESTIDGVGQAGGCAVIANNVIQSNPMECAEGISANLTLPKAFPYAANGNQLQLAVRFDKDMILSSVPPEYQGLAKTIFKGDLDILLEFQK
jgi:hypothetical protein